MNAKQTADDDSSMSEMKVVQFESSTFGNQYVSELSEGPPYTVHGVALGSGDVTLGSSGIKKKWPGEELKRAATSLKGTNLVVDHNNDATGVVGRVTKAGYKEGTGVVYEAELYEESLAEKVKNGLLEVSIRGYHADVDSLEEDDDTGAKVVKDIKFDNLSIVPTGASPSNTLEMGEHAELSAAELSAFTDSLEVAELQEIEPGMWVEWGDQRGITVSQVEDGEIEVDVYAESDGKWRSTGETETVETGSLSEWDVDEDEDIGAAEDEDEDSDEEENAPADDFIFDSKEAAEDFIEGKDDLTGVHEMDDGQWMPGADHDEFSEWHQAQHSEENEAVDRGQFVKWRDHDSNWKHGQIIGIDQEGQQYVAKVRHFTQDGDKLEDLTTKPLQGLDKWDGHPRPSEDGEGKVDETGVTSSDMPGQNAEPDHEPMGNKPSLLDLFKEFIRATTEEASFGDFGEWVDDLSEEELYKINRGEHEEEQYTSEQDLERAHEEEPHRYVDGEGESDEELALEDVDKDHRFNSKEAAMEAVGDMDGVEGVHKMGSVWVPGETHEDYLDHVAESGTHGDMEEDEEDEEEEEASADEGVESDVEELQSVHEPEWSSTKDKEWNKPALNEFTDESWDDLSEDERTEIADHFLVSKTGFPPENFGDLALPVVEPDGTLNLNALTNAKARAGQVEGLEGNTLGEVENMIDDLANDNFEGASFGDEEEEAESNEAKEHEIGGTTGRPTASKTVGGVRVLSGDDLQHGGNEESDVDSLTQHKVIIMDSNIEEKLSELDEPVAVEASDIEELRAKADRFDEMSENLEALRERTDILDSVDHSQVEELAEADDAVVVESARYEELQAEAEQVKGVYAAALCEEYPAFTAEELTESFSIEQLREKFEEHVGDVEEELTATSEDASPKGQDATEEELEEQAEESEPSEEEELSDSIAEKQAELKSKILNR